MNTRDTDAQELLNSIKADEENEQRIMFVREAAIRIKAFNKNMDSRDVWRSAEWLWECKPEDC